MNQVKENSRKAATGLLELGVDEGDTVAVLLRNDFAYLEVVQAAGMVGALAVSINWHFKGDEIRYVLEDSKATVLVVHADILAEYRDYVPDTVTILAVSTPAEIGQAYSIPEQKWGVPDGVTDWDVWRDLHAPWALPVRQTPGTMIYTSGTMGKPKGVKRDKVSKDRQKEIGKLINKWFNFRPGMSTIVNGPLYHSVVSTFTFAALRAGASIVLMPRFDHLKLLEIVASERITHLHLVPTMFVRMLRLPKEQREAFDLSSLEMVIHGAAPCPIEVKRQIIEWFGPVVYEYYGATEFGMVTRCDSNEWLCRPGTTGRAWPGRLIEIHDDDGRPLPSGEVGEICVSLGSIANFTYHNNEDKRDEVDRNGLISVGDAGYLDDDGYLFLTDRKRDMIISGGVNIYPAEVEAEIALYPGVQDAAVFGIPNAEYGEKVVATVEPIPGIPFDAEHLIAFLKDRLANYKLPREIFVKEKLPRDDAGKIRKRTLRDPFWEGEKNKI